MSKEEYSSGCISRANLQYTLKSSEKTKRRVFKSRFKKLSELADVEKLTEPGFSEMARESFNIQNNMHNESDLKRPSGSYLAVPTNYDKHVWPLNSAKTSCDRTASQSLVKRMMRDQ